MTIKAKSWEMGEIFRRKDFLRIENRKDKGERLENSIQSVLHF